MSSLCLTSSNRQEFTEMRIKTPPRWSSSTTDDIFSSSKHDTFSKRRIRKYTTQQYDKKSCPLEERKHHKDIYRDNHANELVNYPKDIGASKQYDEKQNEDLSLDFSWLTKDFQLQSVDECFTCDVSKDSCQNEPEQGLSQYTVTLSSGSETDVMKLDSDLQYERSCIEEEIRQKYAELNAILKQIHSRRTDQKRRRKAKAKKNEVNGELGSDQLVPSYVNICPIRRRKRSAQPIRNALLVRTAMCKAWKGMLGSCCGKGCWATWKWVNLRRVISDYE